MGRTLPRCPEKPPGAKEPDIEKQTYTIEVMTLLMGGGAESLENDAVTPIRGSAVRGQLRFWWRAVRGVGCSTAEELFVEETKIWGSSEKHSPVKIRVRKWQKGKQEPWAEYKVNERGNIKALPDPKDRRFSLYALFPYKGEPSKEAKRNRKVPQKEGPKFCIWPKISESDTPTSFALEVAYPPEYSLEVEAALWGWLNFGGLGARTRRGCGTLYCKDFAPTNAQGIHNWYEERLKHYRVNTGQGNPVSWAVLSSKDHLLIDSSPTDSLSAWSEVIGLLQEFRQGKGVGRNPGQQSNRPGRSRWPEADSLRRITGKSDCEHKHNISKTLRKENDCKDIPLPEVAFPRAELGLPIIFQFQPRFDEETKTMVLFDPESSELYPKEHQRMASPVILKPLMLKDKKAVPMVLQLAAPLPNELELKKVNDPPSLGPSNIRDLRLTQYPNSPLVGPAAKPRSAQGSALEAFMAFAKQRSYR